ncbi:sodium channel and clathrin linker 1 isoform X1 [Gopherus flavomarginatus]|uniref:sodium channel and clathrin linker 1 isoform X1 n=2 Tax=Gopherus flavomarginatus TaxID=286002 RepID=UPI0021CC440B|nr:sodium channel and clathrin linker 1 isoform X1 [Gopherus flavomarginatus]XP_050802410.1 sodium channel and clathrin linker 1 isoform X1 [Gopherus flavomarginatus]XP_050802411.1 sodium channel and clathrin linker 1 isoform X1 [Gopherus flavomarginatus]
MAMETNFLRDQNHRLNAALRQHQAENLLRTTSVQKNVVRGDDTQEPWLTDQSLLSPLIAEYDKHLEEMSEQLQYYRRQMGEMRLKLEQVIKENERLHEELKEAVEKQLEALPSGTLLGSDVFADEEIVRNLQDQLQLANQEKEQALELWQTVSQELDQLQQQYQGHMTEAQIHVVQRQKQKDQLAGFQLLTEQLRLANEKTQLTNQQFLKTVTEQNMELEQLRKQLRQAKVDVRTATAKVDEMTKLLVDLQAQMERKEEDVVSAREREEASDKRLQQLQSSIKQLETRLCVAIQDTEQLRTERSVLEKQTRELQAKCADLEEEKYDAIVKVRDSMQLLEEANLQKNQALLGEKQKEGEIENMKEAISQLVQDAAARTRKEVENARKHYNIQISRLTEELSALQMECGDKQSQIERAIREKRAVEEELEKIYREGRGSEYDYRKLEELHQRCLIAERTKDDLQLCLQAARNKIKQLEMNSEEELSRCQEMVCKLQSILDSERENSGSISEQRLKLHQENEQLHKEAEDLRKLAMEAQQKAKLKISTMEYEHSVKEHGFEVRLKEMEVTNRNSTVQLRRLLVAQQKATNRWKEETKKLTETTETRISNLKSELSRQKLHTQELISQLEMANEKIAENEKLMIEHQEKVNRLQRRLTQAEQKAATASQQLSVITVQRKKAASMVDLENI